MCNVPLELMVSICRSVISLIRGVKSLFPCPICLVPKTSLSNLIERHELRTQVKSQLILNEARKENTAEKCNKHLKGFGLRNVEVRWFISTLSREIIASLLTFFTV